MKVSNQKIKIFVTRNSVEISMTVIFLFRWVADAVKGQYRIGLGLYLIQITIIKC